MIESICGTIALPSSADGPALAATMRRPPRAVHQLPLIFVHGAANSAAVWTIWLEAMATLGWHGYAVDLRGHGASAFDADDDSLANTDMSDYADDVLRLIDEVGQPAAIIGWSMGGLVAMMAAARRDVFACIGLAPSTPSRQRDPAVTLRRGVFGPEEYGLTNDDPHEQPAMPELDLEERRLALDSLGPESRYARDDRKAGIVIDALPCPLLIATGAHDRQWPRSAYNDLWLNADYLTDNAAGHWGLVLRRATVDRLAPAVDTWLRTAVASSGTDNV